MTSTGFEHFWSQGDAITRSVATLLLLMSVSAWVVILWKGWLLRRVHVDLQRAVPAFWAAPTIAAAQGTTLEGSMSPDRNGVRRAGSIGFASLRGGDIVGDHTVMFAGAGERVEITHRSTRRATYADGSVRAARFLLGRQPGLYGMDQVLGL